MRIVLDSSVLFQLGQKHWEFLEEHVHSAKVQVWDSPLGLIEIIRHIHQPDCELRDKTRWAGERCSRLRSVAPKHILPHPGLVVRRALREWLKWDRPDGEVSVETRLYLGLRNALATGSKKADAQDIVDQLVAPTNETSLAFQKALDGLRSELHGAFVEKVRKEAKETPGRFRNIVTTHIQNNADWQRGLFLDLMSHHNVGDWEKAAVALCWRDIPFLRTLMSVYCLQIGRFVEADRPAALEDFIDFEWAAYISSKRLDFFVTDNKRDFQLAFLDAPEIAGKVKTWKEFSELLAA